MKSLVNWSVYNSGVGNSEVLMYRLAVSKSENKQSQSELKSVQ